MAISSGRSDAVGISASSVNTGTTFTPMANASASSRLIQSCGLSIRRLPAESVISQRDPMTARTTVACRILDSSSSEYLRLLGDRVRMLEL
jgi:hypothetical protein